MPPTPKIFTSYAPPRASNPSEPSNTADVRVGRAGSVRFIIRAPHPYEAATTAYVRPSMTNTLASAVPCVVLYVLESPNIADTGTGYAGLVTSIICTALSYQAAVTMAYVRPSAPKTSTSLAPYRAVKPPSPSNTADTGAGFAGSVTSIICTPPSSMAATMPYVRPPISYTSMSAAPPKAVNPPSPSNTADTGAGFAGSVTSIICTKSPSQATVIVAYTRSPIRNTPTSYAQAMEPSLPEASTMVDMGTGRAGSVMSIICTRPSPSPVARTVTTAYVRPSAPNTSTSSTFFRAPDLHEPSNTEDMGTGLSGSVMSIILTPLSCPAVTMQYVRPSMPNTSRSRASFRSPSPSEPPNISDIWMGRAGSVMSMIFNTSLYLVIAMTYVRPSMPNTSMSLAPAME